MGKPKEEQLTKSAAIKMAKDLLRSHRCGSAYAEYQALSVQVGEAEEALLASRAGAKVRRLTKARERAWTLSQRQSDAMKKVARDLLTSFLMDGVTPKNKAMLRKLMNAKPI